jgi:hypothetical protein
MIYFNRRPTIGFGDEHVDRPLPPLELRTAYTVKGLGIGAGGLLGYLAFGPIGMILGGGAGWYAGNRAAIKAEKDFTSNG